MTFKIRILRCSRRLFIVLVCLTVTLFSEKMVISTRCIGGFMSNMIKSVTISNTQYNNTFDNFLLSNTFQIFKAMKNRYRISSYSFRGNYSFLNFEIAANSNSCRNISNYYWINWIFTAETIQGNTRHDR